MPAIDPYAILGLWPGASQEQIKRAYRRAVKKCHPDIDNSPGAREAFLKVQMAYEVLSGNPFYASTEVIRGNGWSASRERTSVDFSPKSVSAYKIRMAREVQSVQSPFFKAGDRAARAEHLMSPVLRKIGRTLWYAYMAIFAGASIGFVVEGIILVGSGRLFEGAAAAAIGLTLIVMLLVVLSIVMGGHLLPKSH